MTVKQVIGARYVPLFSEPIDWDNTKTYEPLTIVYYGGNSYTSKQAVPKGIDITNTDYWALTGNYNAQIEQYRKEVKQLDGRIGANADAIAAETTRATEAEKKNADAIAANTTAINSNTAMLNATAQSPLKTLIDMNTTANAEHAKMLAGTADSGLKALINTFVPESNPIYYGADPTGTTDSAKAINDCIKANYGGSVIFSPGTYLINSAIQTPFMFKNRVNIFGNGAHIKAIGSADNKFSAFMVGYSDNPSENEIKHPSGDSVYNRMYCIDSFKIFCNQYITHIIDQNEHTMQTYYSNIYAQTLSNEDAIVIGKTNAYPGDTRFSHIYIRDYIDDGTDNACFMVNNTDNFFFDVMTVQFKNDYVFNGGGSFLNSCHTLGVGTKSINGCGVIVNDSIINVCAHYNDSKSIAFLCTKNAGNLTLTNGYDFSYTEITSGRTYLSTAGLTNTNFKANISDVTLNATSNSNSENKYRVCDFKDIIKYSNLNFSNIHGDGTFDNKYGGKFTNSLGNLWQASSTEYVIVGYIVTHNYQEMILYTALGQFIINTGGSDNAPTVGYSSKFNTDNSVSLGISRVAELANGAIFEISIKSNPANVGTSVTVLNDEKCVCYTNFETNTGITTTPTWKFDA